MDVAESRVYIGRNRDEGDYLHNESPGESITTTRILFNDLRHNNKLATLRCA